MSCISLSIFSISRRLRWLKHPLKLIWIGLPAREKLGIDSVSGNLIPETPILFLNHYIFQDGLNGLLSPNLVSLAVHILLVAQGGKSARWQVLDRNR